MCRFGGCCEQGASDEQTVYLETTIISYLAAWPSRDLITAAHQHLTLEWWRKQSADYELFASELVMIEAGAGDPDAASRRMDFLKDVVWLSETPEAVALAAELIAKIPLSRKAAVDARHIAIAIVNGIDFLLTWNCRHIADGFVRRSVAVICKEQGYECPVICTPEELSGGTADLE